MRALCIRLLLLFACVLSARRALAADNYAVIVTGASGGEAYATRYDAWRTSLLSVLRTKFGYPDDHLFVLAEHEAPAVATATREHVAEIVDRLRSRLTSDDVLLVVLIGHGTPLDEDDAKFNLVGPDLKASEWAALLKAMPGRLIFVNTAAASFPFLRRLSGPGRVVLTATDSSAQQFETRFPEFFVSAFDAPEADTDKNGRVSIYEAFAYASAEVRRWYDQHGQLPTERALLDDNGDGIGREAQNPGPDGALARTTFLQPAGSPSDTAAVAALRQRQSEIESQIGALKAKQGSMAPDAYAAELERLLVELARISAQLRVKS